jgi:hypothetical protein
LAHGEGDEASLHQAVLSGPTALSYSRNSEGRTQDGQIKFWGAYELLAVRLPDDGEFKLRHCLIGKAADTHQNGLPNPYTLAQRLRKVARLGEEAGARGIGAGRAVGLCRTGSVGRSVQRRRVELRWPQQGVRTSSYGARCLRRSVESACGWIWRSPCIRFTGP